jgi:hypothetical protein
MPQEGNMGRKDLSSRWPRYLMKRRTSTTNGIRAWTSGQQILLGSRGTWMEARYELVSVDIATARMRSIKDWTMWRGRPPSKQKKKLPGALAHEEPDKWELRQTSVREREREMEERKLKTGIVITSEFTGTSAVRRLR